jgi:hypothetical protein
MEIYNYKIVYHWFVGVVRKQVKIKMKKMKDGFRVTLVLWTTFGLWQFEALLSICFGRQLLVIRAFVSIRCIFVDNCGPTVVLGNVHLWQLGYFVWNSIGSCGVGHYWIYLMHISDCSEVIDWHLMSFA